MRRQERTKKKRFQKFITGFLLFLLITVMSAVVVVKAFVVKNVKIQGNVFYDDQVIVDAVLNDEYSWNSLYVLLKYMFVDTQEIPFIEDMEIKLTSPQTITIEVYEKGMLGHLYISVIGQNAYFDKDGFVVETSTRIIESVPMISGIACDEVVLYEKLPIEQQQLKQLLTLTQSLKRAGVEPDSIQFGITNAPVLQYADVKVQMGSMELLTQKIERLKEILPKVEGMLGILHLESWSEESTNIIFEKIEKEESEESENESEDTESGEESPSSESENESLSEQVEGNA